MRQDINITNKSMNLADCKDAWFLDEQYHCWCLEDILYTEKATTPKFQRLSIYLPQEYMSAPGVINENGTAGQYTAKNAPVIFGNNSAGYMQMPHTWLGGPRCDAPKYVGHGFIYVTAGNRGSESRDENGVLCGKAPINLIDLKTVIRFLRHNRQALPGDLDKIITIGWSAGGAMSMLLGATGDNRAYDPYLQEAGAFMDESDAVYASQCYCPIIDLEHADSAYEWMFHEDKQSEDSPAGPAEIMNPFKEALSQKLKEQYIAYFNGLSLKDENGTPLAFGEDGRSGSAYTYLMNCLDAAATTFLNKLSDGGFVRDGEDYHYSVEQYLQGDYSVKVMAPKPPKPDKGSREDAAKNMSGFAGRGVALDLGNDEMKKEFPLEPPTLGEMLSRPPKGVPFKGFEPPMIEVPGDEKAAWLKWDGAKAHVTDLDTYILSHRRRMKGCTSFDTLAMDSGENRVFGSKEEHYKHFSTSVAEAIAALRDDYPQEYAKYYEAYEKAASDEAQLQQKYLINPMNFIGTEEESRQAEYFRIRVGAQDADTSFTVGMMAALKLKEAGKEMDYSLVWDMPHTQADYDGDFIAWIDEIVKK